MPSQCKLDEVASKPQAASTRVHPSAESGSDSTPEPGTAFSVRETPRPTGRRPRTSASPARRSGPGTASDLYHWEIDNVAGLQLASLPDQVRRELATSMDAVVIADPMECQRSPGEPRRPLRTLYFGPQNQGLVTFLVYPPDDLVLVTRIQWLGEQQHHDRVRPCRHRQLSTTERPAPVAVRAGCEVGAECCIPCLRSAAAGFRADAAVFRMRLLRRGPRSPEVVGRCRSGPPAPARGCSQGALLLPAPGSRRLICAPAWPARRSAAIHMSLIGRGRPRRAADRMPQTSATASSRGSTGMQDSQLASSLRR